MNGNRKFFLHSKNNSRFFFILPTVFYGVSVTCYSFYQEIFNNNKIDITEDSKIYISFRDN